VQPQSKLPVAAENPDLLPLLKLRLPSMTKVLKRIGSYIQDNPEQVTVLSINEVADASDASIASVMRLCKELDYNSFAGLKLALATELAVRASEKAVNSVSGAELSHSMQLGETLCEVIRTNAELVKESEIEEIAREIIGARQVILHGVGASYVPANFLAYKLTRLGIINYLSTDSHMTSVAVHASGPDDLLLLFSSSGSVRESIELAELARRTSLATIAFTNRFKSPLRDVCDRQVVCVGSESPLSSGSLESKCGHLLIVELLFDAICEISEVHARRIRDAADAVADMQY